jgi:hypothetical protein
MNDFDPLEDAIKLLIDTRGALTGPDSYVAWLILDAAATRLKAAARRTPLGRPERRLPAQAPRMQVGRRSTDLPGVRIAVRPALADPRVALEEATSGKRRISARAASSSREHAAHRSLVAQ